MRTHSFAHKIIRHIKQSVKRASVEARYVCFMSTSLFLVPYNFKTNYLCITLLYRKKLASDPLQCTFDTHFEVCIIYVHVQSNNRYYVTLFRSRFQNYSTLDITHCTYFCTYCTVHTVYTCMYVHMYRGINTYNSIH